MIDKKTIENLLSQMPEQMDVDDLLSKIVLLHKIENAVLQSDKREVISTDEIKSKVLKWSK